MAKNQKIVTLEQLKKIVPRLKKQGKKVVTTNGGFDLLHVGHIRFLKRARTFGDVLIVALNTDQSMKKRKGDKRPIIPLRHRLEMIAELPFVDYVSWYGAGKPTQWLTAVKPNIHIKDNGRPMSRYTERETIEKYGGKLVLIPYTKETSTTKIIEKIQKLDKE